MTEPKKDTIITKRHDLIRLRNHGYISKWAVFETELLAWKAYAKNYQELYHKRGKILGQIGA